MPTDRDVTWLRDYDEVRDAFSQPGLRQASYDGAKETLFANVLITLDGPPHLARRRAELALFRPELVSLFETSLIPASAAALIKTLARADEADLVDVARLLSTVMAARIVGLDDCDSVERLELLASQMAKLHEGVVIEWSTRPREQVLAEVTVARDRYREAFFAPSYERRIAEIDQPQHGNDLIALLVRHRDREALDEANILRETIHFLVASAHTTATVIVHALNDLWVWLADHPHDAGRAADVDFIQRCVHETMRLWPPSAWQFRIAETAIALKSGRTIAPGETIGLHLIDANRDRAIFGPDAERFDPDRAVPAGIMRYGLAFGAGAHVCIGKRLAAGGAASSGAVGAMVAIVQELLAAGCRPHPARPPERQGGTVRHQYSRYPARFVAGSDAGARTQRPLAAAQPNVDRVH